MLVSNVSGPAVTAYPLAWPLGRQRTPTYQRTRARFGRRAKTDGWKRDGRLQEVSLNHATGQILEELSRLGARDQVLSTNVELRLDGLPYSNRRAPEDPGVAVYFTLNGDDLCLACDRWDRVADNLVALAKWIEATRGQERWVGESMVRAVFTGFKALPAPGETHGIDPWHFLGCDPEWPAEAIEAEIRACLKEAHPDKGGERSEWDRVQWAAEQVRQQLKGRATS